MRGGLRPPRVNRLGGGAKSRSRRPKTENLLRLRQICSAAAVIRQNGLFFEVPYSPNYYAAFVIDPEGYRIEAYCGK